MKKELKNKFKELAKLSKDKGVPKGYIYIGYGSEDTAIFKPCLAWYDDGGRWEVGGYVGGKVPGFEYAAPESVWNKIMKANIYEDKVFIRTVTPKINEEIQLHLFALGFRWFSDTGSPLNLKSQFLVLNYNNKMEISWNDVELPQIEEISIPELFEIKAPKKLVIPKGALKDYEIVCTEEGITIGCQTLDYATFDKITKEINEFRKSF